MATFVQENHQGELFQWEMGAFPNVVLGGSLRAVLVFVLQLYPRGYKAQNCSAAKLFWMILELSDLQKFAGMICEASLKVNLKKSIYCFITAANSRR